MNLCAWTPSTLATPAAAGVVAGSAGASSVFWLLGAVLAVSALAIQRRASDPDAIDDAVQPFD